MIILAVWVFKTDRLLTGSVKRKKKGKSFFRLK